MAVCFVAISLFVGSAPAQATPHIFEDGTEVGTEKQPTNDTEQVCVPLSSGKIDLPHNPSYYDIVLDDPDMVITGYCAKAGSANQGEGPEYFPVPFLETYRITHSSGKELSHVSWSVAPKPIVEPVAIPITDQPEEPTGFDYCGTLFDVPYVPAYDESVPFTAVTTVNGNVTTVELIPDAWRYFAEGIKTRWVFTYTDVVCPVFIVVQPVEPTVCVPLPADTDQYYYALTGDKVFAVAKPGHIFQRDLIVEWPNLFGTPGCETDVPPVNDEETVVIPPVDEVAPPAKEESPVVPAGVVVPVETEVDAKIATPVAAMNAESNLARTGTNEIVLWAAGVIAVLLFAIGIPAARINRARAIKK